jgi:hypothetical protein
LALGLLISRIAKRQLTPFNNFISHARETEIERYQQLLTERIPDRASMDEPEQLEWEQATRVHATSQAILASISLNGGPTSKWGQAAISICGGVVLICGGVFLLAWAAGFFWLAAGLVSRWLEFGDTLDLVVALICAGSGITPRSPRPYAWARGAERCALSGPLPQH